MMDWAQASRRLIWINAKSGLFAISGVVVDFAGERRRSQTLGDYPLRRTGDRPPVTPMTDETAGV
jgi:hypothetical protein